MPEPVPTPNDLVKMGEEYAVVTQWVTEGSGRNKRARPTAWRVLPKGHAHMGAFMKRNAEEAIAAGKGDWHPEPPHSRPRVHDERTEQ